MNSWIAWVWIAALLAVFYFLLIRPQQKRAKAHQQLIAEVKVGDEVVTIGGIHGKVRAVGEDAITVEIDKGVKVKISKNAISKRVVKEEDEEVKESSDNSDSNSAGED